MKSRSAADVYIVAHRLRLSLIDEITSENGRVLLLETSSNSSLV